MGTFITFPELFILLPLLFGVACFFIKNEKAAKSIALFASIVTLVVVVTSLCYTDVKYDNWNNVSYIWLKYIGSTYFVGLDGISRILTLLTAISFPLIIAAANQNKYEKPSSFYGLMLLSQAGLMGVFCAFDALTFYFYWELALIPVYFLASMWGGANRVKATFKFFAYTFVGSLLMLIGIIYVYLHTSGKMFSDGTFVNHSFSIRAFYDAGLSPDSQHWLFWLFFIAFAIKMPIWPFHTWQPNAYDEAPTTVTMIMSGIMVKMGLLGVIRWLIPILPEASAYYTDVVIVLSIIGIIYASCVALVQDNLKRLVAYSSIAHIGLMCAAIFAMNEMSVQGMMIQMFSHGINIIGLWIIVDILEKKTGVKKISELGGVATKAPALTIFLVIIALANIALPLTNAFVGEFMMFAGLWQYSQWFAAVAGISIILAAIYTLNMIRNIFYGSVAPVVEQIKDINISQKLILSVVVVAIFTVGIFPQPLIELTKVSTGYLLSIMGK